MSAGLWNTCPYPNLSVSLPISSRTYTVLNKIQCEGRSEEELIDLTSEVTPWKKLEDKTLGGTWQQTVQPGD